MANYYSTTSSQKPLSWFLVISLMLHFVMLFALNNNERTIISVSPQGSPAQQFLQVSLQKQQIAKVIKKRIKPKKLKKKVSKKIVKNTSSPKVIRKSLTVGDETKFKSFIKNYTKPIYPRIAQRRTLVGNVLLELNISKKGDLLSVKISKSSGHEILDISALSAAKLWTFKPLASNMEQLSLRKKIVFAMKI